MTTTAPHHDPAARAAAARAAELLEQADALVVAAGAGMGVDSGLPDFRGNEGFWRAYPALGRARRDFASIASPAAFHATPALAWGRTPEEADARVKSLSLYDVKAALDAAIAARPTDW